MLCCSEIAPANRTYDLYIVLHVATFLLMVQQGKDFLGSIQLQEFQTILASVVSVDGIALHSVGSFGSHMKPYW